MSRTKNVERMIRAASNGDRSAVEYWLDSGIEVDAQDRHGNRAINLASKEGHLDVVRLLAERGAQLNDADAIGRIPLMAAAEGDHVNVIDFLLSAGADVNCKGGDGRTALMECANSNSFSAAGLLLERGADVNARSEQGVTALHEAVFCACEDYEEPADNQMIPLLVRAGADTHAADADGLTPSDLVEQYADEIDYTELLRAK